MNIIFVIILGKRGVLYSLCKFMGMLLGLFSDDVPTQNTWAIPSPGGGPPLPPEVKVELLNGELWQQFHAETTEMIITKLGR